MTVASVPSFSTSRAFNVALGRLASAPDALQTAVQHAAMHALHDGQCTPANRFRATLASAHMLGSIGARAALFVLAEALASVATLAEDGQYRVKAKGRAEYLTLDMAIAKAGALDVGARIAVMQAEAAAARTKAKASKEAKADPVSDPAAPLVSMLAKVAEAASAEAEALAKADASKGPIDARSICTASATLAAQPGALAALAGLIDRAFGLVSAADAASVASMAEAHRIAIANAKAETLAAQAAKADIRTAFEAAKAEAASVHAEALAMAEATQAAKVEALAARCEAEAAKAEAEAAKAEALAMLADAGRAKAEALAMRGAAEALAAPKRTAKRTAKAEALAA